MKEKIEYNPSNDVIQYLNDIIKKLWSGHVAVMVGAGFNKNAKPSNLLKKGFPSWIKLGNIFYKKIYDSEPKENQLENLRNDAIGCCNNEKF